MIAAADGDKVILLAPVLGVPVLHSHFQGHFHGHRAGVRIEYLLHGRRNQRQEQFSEFDGGVVRQSAEHDVRHLAELFRGCPVQRRMVVTVYGAPPRGHSLYQRLSAFQRNRCSVRPLHLIYRQRIGGRSVWMPQMLAVELRTAELISGFFYQLLVVGNLRAERGQQVAHDGRVDTYI